jgi:AMMECR1 domain-containing protein
MRKDSIGFHNGGFVDLDEEIVESALSAAASDP